MKEDNIIPIGVYDELKAMSGSNKLNFAKLCKSFEGIIYSPLRVELRHIKHRTLREDSYIVLEAVKKDVKAITYV